MIVALTTVYAVGRSIFSEFDSPTPRITRRNKRQIDNNERERWSSERDYYCP